MSESLQGKTEKDNEEVEDLCTTGKKKTVALMKRRGRRFTCSAQTCWLSVSVASGSK